jgi:xanthine dehydrogenase molybdopterin-binding subunit B
MKRIEKLERKLRPSQIFDNKVFDELQSIRRSHAEAERKVQNGDLTAIDDLRAILEAIDRTSEYAERLRSKSAFDAVKEIFKTGVIITVTLFGVFITLGQ